MRQEGRFLKRDSERVDHGFGVHVRSGRFAFRRQPVCVELDSIDFKKVVYRESESLPSGDENMVWSQRSLSGKPLAIFVSFKRC